MNGNLYGRYALIFGGVCCVFLIGIGGFFGLVNIKRASVNPHSIASMGTSQIPTPFATSPKITTLTYPSLVIVGDSIQIHIVGANQGTNALEGDMVIEFPSIPSATISYSSTTTVSTAQSGDTIAYNYGTTTTTASYVLFDAWVAPWNAGISQSMTITLTAPLPAPQTFHFYSKLVMQDSSGSGPSHWSSDPPISAGYPTDQQAEAVYDNIIAINPQTGTINVNTNLYTASFTLTGPATYSGMGTSWSQSSASVGDYTINYDSVSGYVTPSPESKTLATGGTITFTGTYTPIPPTAPQNLLATAGDSQVTLTWNVPASDGGTPIVNYKIYRSTSSGSEIYLTIVSGSTLTYVDTSVTNGITYYYQVNALTSVAAGPMSTEVSATPHTLVPEFSPAFLILTILLIAFITTFTLRKKR